LIFAGEQLTLGNEVQAEFIHCILATDEGDIQRGMPSTWLRVNS